jgi:hypothetical protein
MNLGEATTLYESQFGKAPPWPNPIQYSSEEQIELMIEAMERDKKLTEKDLIPEIPEGALS